MKYNQLLGVVCGFLAWWGSSPAARAEVTLTVSPAVVSNTYPGRITLAITGLNSGEKVAVLRWMDLNGNGAIDSGEPLMDAFNLVDNIVTNALIGGITNVNIPVDLNPTAGAITASLGLPSIMTLENLTGHFVYEVASSTGRFTPVTATFVVTNTPQAQSVSGTVCGPDGTTPVAHALVVAQDQAKDNPVAGVITDSNGRYSLPLPASSYYLIAALPNYFYDQALAPSVALTNGMNVTNHLTLTNGTAGLSGKICDTVKSNGIPGLLFTLSSGTYFGVGFTDTNGNFSANVTTSSWVVLPNRQRLARRGFVLPTAAPYQFDVTSGSATGAVVALPKGAALFYGQVTDNTGAGCVNLEVEALNTTNYVAKGYTDTNGNYSVAVLGDGSNKWNCVVSSGRNTAVENLIFNYYDELALTNTQTVLENFTGRAPAATISGQVRDNTGASVAGVQLVAVANIGGTNFQALTATTDSSGNYSLSVINGQWAVQFLTGNYSDALDVNGYEDVDSPHWVAVPPTNAVLNLTVYPIGTPVLTQARRTAAGTFGFTLNGAENVSYTVQVSTNLAKGSWTTLYSLVLTNSSVLVTDPAGPNGARYYRVLKN